MPRCAVLFAQVSACCLACPQASVQEAGGIVTSAITSAVASAVASAVPIARATNAQDKNKESRCTRSCA